MKKLIYLVFETGAVHASFVRRENFDVEWWAAQWSGMLKEIGVKKVEFELVPDDFCLAWEE